MYFKLNTKCNQEQVQTKHSPVQMAHFAPLFYTTLVFFLLSIITFVIEKIAYKCCRELKAGKI